MSIFKTSILKVVFSLLVLKSTIFLVLFIFTPNMKGIVKCPLSLQDIIRLGDSITTLQISRRKTRSCSEKPLSKQGILHSDNYPEKRNNIKGKKNMFLKYITYITQTHALWVSTHSHTNTSHMQRHLITSILWMKLKSTVIGGKIIFSQTTSTVIVQSTITFLSSKPRATKVYIPIKIYAGLW